MAIPKCPLSPVLWEQDSLLQVKVKEEDEAGLSQSHGASPSPTAHPEAARLRFRHFRYEAASSPHQALAQLRELCCQWLRPESSSKEQMLELLVLEQFLGALPPEIQTWVGAQCPKSGKEAAVLVEDLTQLLDKRGEQEPQAGGSQSALAQPGSNGGGQAQNRALRCSFSRLYLSHGYTWPPPKQLRVRA